MRAYVQARQKPWEWHQWFAWRPVRIPASVYEDGVWIWREYVWRKQECGWGDRSWKYALEKPE